MYMLYNLLIFLVVGCYLTATIIQILFLTAKLNGKQTLVFYLGLLAVLGHGWLLYAWIETSLGQNLTLFNLFSQTAWLVAVIHLFLAMRKPLENLGIFIFPISAVSIILAISSPDQSIVNTALNLVSLVHLLLAIAAFSTFCLAACQALLMAIQNWQLRHKDTRHALRILPPVESMEKLLFQLIGVGFILLNILIVSSFYFFNDIFYPPLLSKILLAVLAWLIFAILLVGRFLFGWRSNTVICWTLSGVVLLLICYLVNQLIA
ncbi:MAG: ABC-type uncharacterized transport system, permease component [Gammaproteobacteria bacterium]|jgi:ABC-type uncharacterized transport system permease subunit|nr:ABC-type uncharacterized transport system, permease component [Gammaproteobacteria bacterium]